jgi:LmbE family N-acetylglucosaminyl deacetylase
MTLHRFAGPWIALPATPDSPDLHMPEASRVFVISPHFDDAVFSCGAWIASHSDAVVCTEFAGYPNGHVTTNWDRQCGFTDARHAMRERIAEDDRALNTLGVASERLDFLDAQYVPYGEPPTADAIERALCTIIRSRRPTTLAIPLGLYHSDHVLVHGACRNGWLSAPRLECIAYEDALYRRMDGLVHQRLADLLAHGIALTPAVNISSQARDERHTLRKREAVHAYKSQLNAFGPHGYDDVLSDERYWRLDVVNQ